jgi:Tfp pilus assembly protein PilO
MQLQIKGIKKEQYAKYLELIPDIKRKKTQKYITIVLTLVTSIILGLFAINPTFSTIANLQKQINDNNFVDQKLQQKLNNLSILQQKYSAIQSDLPIISNAVPTTTQIPLFTAEIQSIAKDSSITLTGFQTAEVDLAKATAGKYSSFDFTVSASGNYQNMQNFLSKLINFQRIIALKEVNLSTDNSVLKLSVMGTVFFMK